jgi:hypothetical protein
MFAPVPQQTIRGVNVTFGANAEPAVMTLSGGQSSFIGTVAFPLTVDGHNANVLELV